MIRLCADALPGAPLEETPCIHLTGLTVLPELISSRCHPLLSLEGPWLSAVASSSLIAVDVEPSGPALSPLPRRHHRVVVSQVFCVFSRAVEGPTLFWQAPLRLAIRIVRGVAGHELTCGSHSRSRERVEVVQPFAAVR